jgi:hypothetical protein
MGKFISFLNQADMPKNRRTGRFPARAAEQMKSIFFIRHAANFPDLINMFIQLYK